MTDTKQSLTVLKVNGEVFARTPGGNLRLLKPGDVLHEGDLLVTASGSTVLQDASGQTLELPPNHSVRIGPDGLDSLHGQTELSTPSADPQPAGPITEDGAATGGTRANTAETGSGEAEDGGLREGDGHGFVRLSRIDYRGFGEAADPGRLGRDVNDTHDFDARATLNPRLAYFHDLPEGNLGTLLPETERPFWSDEASAAPGWANRRPIANPDSAETDEDVPVVIDPLPNDTDADGHALSIVEATALNGSVTINPDGTVT